MPLNFDIRSWACRQTREVVDATIESLGAEHVLGVVLNGVEGLARRYSKYNKYYRYSTRGSAHTGKKAL